MRRNHVGLLLWMVVAAIVSPSVVGLLSSSFRTASVVPVLGSRYSYSYSYCCCGHNQGAAAAAGGGGTFLATLPVLGVAVATASTRAMTTGTSTATAIATKASGAGDESLPRSKKRPRMGNSDSALSATTTTTNNDAPSSAGGEEQEPLYLEEGLFAVHKPLGWTSQDVVGKLRNVLEKDARTRGAPDRRTKRRKPWMKVGHGGTLDPLATGVLVCGVGSGTRNLQKYLVGSKGYRAEVTLGYQTTTLDADPTGSVVEEKPYDHVVSRDEIDAVLQSQFTGTIRQVPPIFSALKRDGKKLYELGRKGQTAEDIKIEPREVVIYDLKLVEEDKQQQQQQQQLPIQKFRIDVECGGGTYIRSLVRDIGIALGTVATMTALERTKQGQFLPEHCVPYRLLDDSDDDDDNDENANASVNVNADGKIVIDKKGECNWTVATITEAIRACRDTVLTDDGDDGLKSKDNETN